MIVLTTSTLAQSFDFIPSNYTQSTEEIYHITIDSETENKQIYSDSVSSFTENRYFYNYSGTFNLKSDNFYILKIKKNEDLIFSDKIFCTDQSFSDIVWNTSGFVWNLLSESWDNPATGFSVNKGDYVKHSSDNEFIII